ncbi:class I SAM-dependent DNA methyltransferase [Nesterenkonia muleiensis]|uniref:class I SAM-dependent DNA methyltransferase n=1 Tax=Nesterenkonia muleiensis TaxID=2282648 RepID=UPI00192E7500|nr:class I SAM-dependent methyltransferase [Nesterenkonia muleiensis]
MPEILDGEFRDPRLAAVYDALDPDRTDLRQYQQILLEEFGASTVLDIGCGTGVFALQLAACGVTVHGVDPAEASLKVARSKPGADAVTWHAGTADTLPPLQVDAITMTANVAQVFITDEDFDRVLSAGFSRLRPGGVLVFEARRAEDRGWERWTREQTRKTVQALDVGRVDSWNELRAVDGELTTHAVPVIFHHDGARYDSVSTLRFRSREAIEAALERTGFTVHDVRDTEYAPGRGWMYIALVP